MVFGWFKKNEVESRIKELEERLKGLERKPENHINKSIISLATSYRSLKNDFENFKERDFKEFQETTESYMASLEISLNQNKMNTGTKNQVLPDKKVSLTTAILNILKNSKHPLDFNSIKDKIKEYDLKVINTSDKSIRQSIYNLIYNQKVAHGKKRGTYQIRTDTQKD